LTDRKRGGGFRVVYIALHIETVPETPPRDCLVRRRWLKVDERSGESAPLELRIVVEFDDFWCLIMVLHYGFLREVEIWNAN